MPTVPPAPGRLSITICCPSRALSSVAIMRLVTSGPLPGPQGTMNRMGFVGYCANAEVGARPSRSAIRASASKSLRIFPSVLTNVFNVRYGSEAAIALASGELPESWLGTVGTALVVVARHEVAALPREEIEVGALVRLQHVIEIQAPVAALERRLGLFPFPA